MHCTVVRTWLFRKIDDELSPAEDKLLDSHLAQCPACAREFRILAIPRRIGQMIPALQPGPYFYSKLRARIENESQSITIWQIMLGLSRQMVPALAAITLALLSIFAYLQLRGPRTEVYQAYDKIFMSGDRPHRMVIADQGEITDESVFLAIAEQDTNHRTSADTKGKK